MRAVLTILVTIAASFSPPTTAMTVPDFSEAELRAHADVVVDGVVGMTQTRRIGTRIMTFVSVISGTAPRLTTTLVAVPGGDFGGFSQRVPGSPQLEVGRRYRLYLGVADGPQLDGGARARGVFAYFRGAFLLDDSTGEAIPFGDDGLPAVVR